MDARPVTAAAGAAPGSWKLKPEYASATQGLVASPFGHLQAAQALFLSLPKGVGGSWLQALRAVVGISDATGSREDDSAAAIAFTWTGLAAMNLPPAALDSFSMPFLEGMHQADRRRRLSDDPELGTVIAGGARWSGKTPDVHLHNVEPPTPITVHCVLLVYERDEATLDARLAPVKALLEGRQVSIGHERRLSLRMDAKGIGREHFGFADGMSQPVPTGEAITEGAGTDAQRHWHGVPAGEVLLGHLNAHHELAPGPMVVAAPGTALSADGVPDGFLNLGLNGSYLVIRELLQDVPAFWNSLDAAAQTIGQQEIDGKWLAERIVGRTTDGDPLRPDGVIVRQNGQPVNDFGYAHTDVQGFGCPLGSHIRRANPRDSLPSRDGAEPDLSTSEQLLSAANAHRILRRGRKFGPEIADPRHADGVERGLMFMCLNSDLVRQFEFVQQTWILNQSFATLFDETDPLLGPPGRMTIPACPLRLRPEVKTYVQMVGGEYFFLPSMPALDYLGGLRPSPPKASPPKP